MQVLTVVLLGGQYHCHPAIAASERGIECVWLLLDFADFAEETRAAAEGLPTQELRRLDEVLGGRAAELFEAFVASGRAQGLAGPWSSTARNSLAQDYSFALLGRREAHMVARALGERGICRVVDPMAGTGLHARLLSEAGLQVEASDAQPGTAGGFCWHPVSQRFLEAHQLPSNSDAGFGGDCSHSALFLSWPPRSEAAASALRSFSGPMLVVVGDRGKWHGSESFHKALEENWSLVLQADLLTWPRLQDDLRIFCRVEKRIWGICFVPSVVVVYLCQ
ncbi:unnamed protein product [Symbiodinium sp. CCMP2592]|nr:unnamed protein product [Symbiodinium sp. CCMP2592]